MTVATIARRALRDHRAITGAMGAVGFAMAVLLIAIYPSYSEQLADFEVPPALQGFIGEAPISSPEGFMTAEFFSWMPALYIVAGVIAATYAVAGDEGAGTLDLVLSQPVKRWHLLVGRAAGIAIGLVIAVLASVPGFLLMKPFIDFDLSPLRILEGISFIIPLAFLFTSFALWMSAALPTRAAAGLVSTAAIVSTYFLNLLGGAVDALSLLRKLSPFYWGDGGPVLLHGFDWPRAAGMLLLAAAFLALAFWSLERRDIAAGSREWRPLRWRRAGTVAAD